MNVSLILLFKANNRGFVVQASTKASQIVFNYLPSSQRFQDIQKNQEQATHVRATEISWWRPTFPSLAPSIRPGRSRSWILAPLHLRIPGKVVRVVNSGCHLEVYIDQVSELVDFPRNRKTPNPIQASPVLATSKRSGAPTLPPSGVMSSPWTLAERAVSSPKCCAVVSFLVRAIAALISEVLTKVLLAVACPQGCSGFRTNCLGHTVASQPATAGMS